MVQAEELDSHFERPSSLHRAPETPGVRGAPALAREGAIPADLKRLAVRPWAGIRVGEARNPGPWRVVATNATSMPRNEEALVRTLARLQADLAGVTETRLGELNQPTFARRLDKRGFTAVWGKPRPLVRRRNGRRSIREPFRNQGF